MKLKNVLNVGKELGNEVDQEIGNKVVEKVPLQKVLLGMTIAAIFLNDSLLLLAGDFLHKIIALVLCMGWGLFALKIYKKSLQKPVWSQLKTLFTITYGFFVVWLEYLIVFVLGFGIVIGFLTLVILTLVSLVALYFGASRLLNVRIKDLKNLSL